MSNFGLIKQVNDEEKLLHILERNCAILVKDNVVSLYESAQQLLGKAVAQIAAGQDPGSNDPNFINIVAGLHILADPENLPAFNLDATNAAKLLNLVGVNPDATARVAYYGAHSPTMVNSVKTQMTGLPKMDNNAKQKVISQLNSLRLAFTKLEGKAKAKQKPNMSFAPTRPVSRP